MVGNQVSPIVCGFVLFGDLFRLRRLAAGLICALGAGLGSLGKCGSGPSTAYLRGSLGWAASGATEHFAQGLSLAGGVVPVGLGLVAELAAHPDDGDGGIGQAGEVAGQLAGADAAAVLVVGDVADVVYPVLDLPVPRFRASTSAGPARAGAREVRP